MNIGVVDYLNALPFTLPYQLGILKTAHTFIYATPSELNRRFSACELQVALTSSVAFLDGTSQMVPKLGIAAHDEILSVNLYLQGELDSARIGLTQESATSVALLKVLCQHFWRVKPSFVTLDAEHDGFLLIGDKALKNLFYPNHRTIDLARAWYEATSLPFVFALVVKEKGVEYCGEEFECALQWSEAHHDRVVEAAYQKSGLSKALLSRYYTLIHYRLSERELEGLYLFQELRNHV